ncbi:hypothetical protein SAMN04244575_06422 [Sinorhizobium meliloti]|nr:hypothetical protein SAMN04244575_06422 [Sinorhizobium meliloti]
MEKVSIIGLDLAKSTIQVHAASVDGSVLFRRKISSKKLLAFLSATSALVWLIRTGEMGRSMRARSRCWRQSTISARNRASTFTTSATAGRTASRSSAPFPSSALRSPCSSKQPAAAFPRTSADRGAIRSSARLSRIRPTSAMPSWSNGGAAQNTIRTRPTSPSSTKPSMIWPQSGPASHAEKSESPSSCGLCRMLTKGLSLSVLIPTISRR